MRFEGYEFGSIRVDGTTYDHDLVIDHGEIRKRRKGPARELRAQFGPTPLTVAEDIPWDCRRLVIGSGAAGSLPIVDDVGEEAARRGVELLVLPTPQAIEEL